MGNHGIPRREFMRWASAATALTPFHEAFLPRLGAALADAVREYPLIWMQNAACSGCSVSVINTIHPSIKNVILDQILPGHQLFLNYHSTLMAAAGRLSTDAALETAKKNQGKYVFIVEGAIPTRDGGIDGTLGEEGGKPVPMLEWVRRLAPGAMAILAVGTCAAYGGLPAAAPNPTESKGIGDVLKILSVNVPVINIPGCPCHPDWFIGTVARVLLYGIPPAKDCARVVETLWILVKTAKKLSVHLVQQKGIPQSGGRDSVVAPGEPKDGHLTAGRSEQAQGIESRNDAADNSGHRGLQVVRRANDIVDDTQDQLQLLFACLRQGDSIFRCPDRLDQSRKHRQHLNQLLHTYLHKIKDLHAEPHPPASSRLRQTTAACSCTIAPSGLGSPRSRPRSSPCSGHIAEVSRWSSRRPA